MSDAASTGENVPCPPDGLALAAFEESEKSARRRETIKFYGGIGMDEFARRLGVSGKDPEKMLKRWIEKGREVSPVDLPPFQRPHELAAWWRRLRDAGVMGKSPPPWMNLLEQTGPAAAASPPSSSPSPDAAPGESVPPNLPAPADLPPDFILPVLDDQASSGEKQLREFAEGWLAEMASAKKAQNTGRFFKAWNEYKALIKELRAWQKDRQRERLQSGEVLEADREREALGLIFGAMNKTFTSSLLLLIERFAPGLDVTERRQIVLPFRDKIFASLKATRFESAIPLEELTTYLAA